jgi:hypothetical protein
MPVGVSAYVALANVTLGSTASSVTFSSITGAYRDLILVFNFQGTGSGFCSLTLNGDTSNFSRVTAFGNSGAVSSGTASDSNFAAFTSSFNNLATLQFMDYSATDKHKTILGRTGTGTDEVMMNTIRWASTAALTSITINTPSADFAAGSTFALYGIAS